MLPKNTKTLHNRRLCVLHGHSYQWKHSWKSPACRKMSCSTIKCMQVKPLALWDGGHKLDVSLSPQGWGSVLRRPLVVWKTNCMPRQISTPPRGSCDSKKQRLWHNESLPRLTVWLRKCTLDDESEWFSDVDVHLRPYPPHFLSFLDHCRKREQPRLEWWEFLVVVHIFHLPNRESSLLEAGCIKLMN